MDNSVSASQDDSHGVVIKEKLRRFYLPAIRDDESPEQFTTRSESEQDRYRSDVVHLNKLASVRRVVYFNELGQPLFANDNSAKFLVDQWLDIRLENHMPHFRAVVRRRKAETSTDDGSHKENKIQDDDVDKNSDEEDTCDIYEPMNNAAPKVIDNKLGVQSTVQIMISYQAYVHSRCTDAHPDAVQSREDQANIQSFSPGIQQHIQDLLLQGYHPCVIRLFFRCRDAACSRIYFGTPIWASNWAHEARRGSLLAVMPGRTLTKPRFDILSELLQKYQATSGPLDQFYNSEAGVHHIHPRYMKSSPPHQRDYDYRTHSALFDFDEWATEMGSYLLSERKLEKEHRALFGTKSRSLRGDSNFESASMCHSKINRAQLDAIESMNHPSKFRPYTEWNNQIKLAILGSRFDLLTPKDAFQKVQVEFEDVTQLMELNVAQKKAVSAMSSARGGISIIAGPAGTGKSYLALQIMKPFLLSRNLRQILLVTAANTGVNRLAANVDELLNELHQDGKLARQKYILRLYTNQFEHAIRETEANKIPVHGRGESDWQNLEGLEASLARQERDGECILLAESSPKTQGTRFVRPDLSVAVKALEIAGIVKGPNTATSKARFAQLRAAWSKYKEGSNPNKDDLDNLMKDAMGDAIRKASVIITTTDYAGFPGVLDLIENSVDIVIADNSPREREVSYAPLFAARFTQLDGFIMMGDWHQLGPLVPYTPKESVFADQMRMSFMPRLVQNGFPYSRLNEQYRMNESLSILAKKVQDNDGLFSNDESTMMWNRHLSAKFQEWTLKFANVQTSALLINVLRGEANVTRCELSLSRYNDFFVITAANLAHQLLLLDPNARVAMLTAYGAHRDRLCQARDAIMKQHPELFSQNDPFRLVAETVDAAHGEEYDYVIDCVLIERYDYGNGLGFQADRHRCNVASTRARDGYVLIVDHFLLDNMRASRPEHRRKELFTQVERLIGLMYKSRLDMPSGNSLPACPFYTPRG